MSDDVKSSSKKGKKMDALTLWSLVGFLLAAYAVIANDSVQTLGTWMASNNERFNYKTLWIAASGVLLATLWLSLIHI